MLVYRGFWTSESNQRGFPFLVSLGVGFADGSHRGAVGRLATAQLRALQVAAPKEPFRARSSRAGRATVFGGHPTERAPWRVPYFHAQVDVSWLFQRLSGQLYFSRTQFELANFKMFFGWCLHLSWSVNSGQSLAERV